MAHLDHAATKQLDKVEFDPPLRELVRIRASQLNGCAYCIDMHTKDARAIGESEQRLYALSAWRETPFFTERERAALAFTESVTLAGPRPRTGRGLRGGRRAVQRSRDRRAGQPDRDDQRLERDRREHARLDAGLVRAVSGEPPPGLDERPAPGGGRVRS